jgi:DNA-binding beta-propeller fold protein YncE
MGWARGAAALLLAPLLVAACRSAPAPLVIGRPGRGPGEFDTPRGVAAARGRVAVVDRTGRVQRFDAEGKFEREHRVLPEDAKRGFPLGLLLLDDDGELVVHTHDASLVRYGADGREAARFGETGVKDGTFCMPQRAVAHGGFLYVSDFGYEECRRVEVFTPGGKFVRRLGGPGSGAVYERPMGLAVDAAGVLWVADESNRLFRFEAESGRLLGSVGSAGDGTGQLAWPTGVAALPGGGVVVCEAGNHRLQRFAPDGTSLGTFGHVGIAPGEFREPYDLAADPPFLFVADAGNHRVQRFRLDGIPWETAR